MLSQILKNKIKNKKMLSEKWRTSPQAQWQLKYNNLLNIIKVNLAKWKELSDFRPVTPIIQRWS